PLSPDTHRPAGQRCGGRSADGLDVPRRVGIELAATSRTASRGRDAAERGIYFYPWLDGHARRGRAGRRDFLAQSAAGRLSLPAAKHDYFSYVLRDFRDAGVSRLVAAIFHSPPG